jgi:hypothetical protein
MGEGQILPPKQMKLIKKELFIYKKELRICLSPRGGNAKSDIRKK